MEYPIEVQLKRPIKDGDQVIDKLVFDEPDVGLSIEVTAIENPLEQTIVLLSGMAELPRDLFLKMKESDYVVVRERVLKPYNAQFQTQAEGDEGNDLAAT